MRHTAAPIIAAALGAPAGAPRTHRCLVKILLTLSRHLGSSGSLAGGLTQTFVARFLRPWLPCPSQARVTHVSLCLFMAGQGAPAGSLGPRPPCPHFDLGWAPPHPPPALTPYPLAARTWQ